MRHAAVKCDVAVVRVQDGVRETSWRVETDVFLRDCASGHAISHRDRSLNLISATGLDLCLSGPENIAFFVFIYILPFYGLCGVICTVKSFFISCITAEK